MLRVALAPKAGMLPLNLAKRGLGGGQFEAEIWDPHGASTWLSGSDAVQTPYINVCTLKQWPQRADAAMFYKVASALEPVKSPL